MNADTNNICIYSNLFFFGANILPTKVHSEFISTIKTTVIVDNDLDYDKHTNNSFYFSKFYYNMIIEKKIPEFESTNYINVLPYQKYLNVFSDLTPVKKAFIACAYPIMSVIKWKPSRTSLTTLYHWI